ncbi:MAG TPA: hypothetical protein VHD36_20260 [Pirellulales bacterium]|nr:hypothetical protein [Pirellulales bacterium]
MSSKSAMQKSLDRKLAAIHADPSGSREFIIADAKDADMAFGIGAPGQSPEMHAGEVRLRTLAEYREQMRQIVRQGLVDIMLMSASSNDLLTIQEGLFENSHVTPAARANDTSDIFVLRGNKYIEEPSRPFRTAAIDHIQCGHVECAAGERGRGANLGLYSITFNNRLDEDLAAVEEYRRFRIEAESKGFRHFLEVFDPNAPVGLDSVNLPHFINDSIARTLAGVAQAGRPVFLKVVYHGPKAMEELVAYDPHLVVGILGGGAGTTYDAFKLISEAQKYGARVALFGRKINQAENQLAFVEFLRLITDRLISPEEAVRAYHSVLQKLSIKPQRSLAEDLELRTGVMSYGGGSTVTVPAGVSATTGEKKKDCGCGCGGKKKAAPAEPSACGCPDKAAAQPSASTDGAPDFKRMSQAEKLAYNQRERDRIFGSATR